MAPHTTHEHTLKMQKGSEYLSDNRHPGPSPSKLSWKGKETHWSCLLPLRTLPSRVLCFEPGHLVAEAGFELTSSCFNFPKAVLFTSVNAKPKRELGLDVLPEFAPVSSRERSHSFQQCQRSKSRGQQQARCHPLSLSSSTWLLSFYESKALDSVLSSPVFCSGKATMRYPAS